MIYNLFTKKRGFDAFCFQWSKLDRCFSDKRRRCSFKICSSPIWMKTAFCGGVFEKDSQYIYKISAIEKHPLPISTKMTFWYPCWEQCLPFVYKNPSRNNSFHLIATGKWKPHPLLKNIPHLIGQKMGKMHPSLRIVYFLFTKIERTNKNRSGRFSPKPLWHMIWGGTLGPTP